MRTSNRRTQSPESNLEEELRNLKEITTSVSNGAGVSSSKKGSWRLEIWGNDKSCDWKLDMDKHALVVRQIALRMIKDPSLYTLMKDALRVSVILEVAENEANELRAEKS